MKSSFVKHIYHSKFSRAYGTSWSSQEQASMRLEFTSTFVDEYAKEVKAFENSFYPSTQEAALISLLSEVRKRNEDLASSNFRQDIRGILDCLAWCLEHPHYNAWTN